MLSLISAGLQTDEINKRARKFKPAYEVSRQQVDFYRDSRGVKLDEIKESSESEALRRGFALVENRVEALNELAELLKEELKTDRRWLPRVKQIGTGKHAKVVHYEEFNRVELNSFRDVLDDIAKEMGGRTYGISASEEDEDDPAGGSAPEPQALCIKVEYVGAAAGDHAPASDSPHSAAEDRP